jgi:putative aldouronate transport system substrate-binding protein
MKKVLAILLSCIMVFAATSCSMKKDSGTTSTKADPNVTLTYWMDLNAVTAQVAKSMADTEFAKELTKETGVKVKFQHPAVGQVTEAFNVLVASGDYPDIIEYKWQSYTGGPAAAIKNKVILPLNDTFKKYSPNITKVLKNSPDVNKMVQTDAGQYYVYPFLRGTTTKGNEQLASDGFVIRKDMLEKVGLGVPSTPDDWYKVLTAFKTQLKIKTPLTLKMSGQDPTIMSQQLAGGFDNWGDYYIDNGKVKNGLVESTRYNYLATMHKWYSEGLLDNDYLVVDSKAQNSKMLNSTAGATYAPGGSGLGTWNTTMKAKDASVDFVSTPPITSTKGKNAKFSKIQYLADGSGAAITTSCKHVDQAAKLLDYLYGDKGHMLADFGIEGESYTMKNGAPIYTADILNNPKGLSISAAMSIYMRGHLQGPLVTDSRELDQYYNQTEQQEALKLWTKTDMAQHQMPLLTVPTADNDAVTSIVSNIKDYSNEMEAKFISGATPLTQDSFNKYVAQINTLGLDKALKVYQTAYAKYLKR